MRCYTGKNKQKKRNIHTQCTTGYVIDFSCSDKKKNKNKLFGCWCVHQSSSLKKEQVKSTHIKHPHPSLCVEDELGNLSIFYRCAVVVTRSVAEGKAGLSTCSRSFMSDFAHTLCPIVGVWSLHKTKHTSFLYYFKIIWMVINTRLRILP